MGTESENGRRFFTTSEVARYCAVTNDGVLKWIKSGKLRAFSTPGGHYRVSMEDFRAFLKKFDIPIDEAFFKGAQKTRTVLVVDDEESVGEFMRELLDTWGLRATYLARPLEALDAVVREPSRFDVVITDQSMPRMTGVQLARALREIRGDLSVILYTGYSDGVGQQDIAAAGLKAVLKKPVDPVALRTALDTCLRPARTG